MTTIAARLALLPAPAKPYLLALERSPHRQKLCVREKTIDLLDRAMLMMMLVLRTVHPNDLSVWASASETERESWG
jgi:hypothetical protein